MNVSEKLQRLQKRRLEDSSLASVDAESAILDALPQIEALVIWTERFSDLGDYHAWTNTEHPRLAPELDAILAALDEALS